MAVSLPEDLIEEVLLRLPPDDPASLARAALVSKRWCRLVCGRGFRRRFRAFHGGTPPLLGLVCQHRCTPFERFFLLVSSFHPRDHSTDRRNMEAVHSRHGRVLLHSARWSPGTVEQDLFVWDPITDKLWKLPRWPMYSYIIDFNFNAVVLCAGAAAVADGCSHRLDDCHNGPFIVVLAGTYLAQTSIFVYSSEADRWTDQVYAEYMYSGVEKGNSVIVGSAVYFKCWFRFSDRFAILKYDLLTCKASMIHVPSDGVLQERHSKQRAVLMAMDGRLGLALTRRMLKRPKLYLWSSMEHGPDDEDTRWEQSIVMDLGPSQLLQAELRWTRVAAFADNGAGGRVIFILSSDGLFSIDLKSRSIKLVGDSFDNNIRCVVPYVSYCIPALGTVEEGLGAGEPSE